MRTRLAIAGAGPLGSAIASRLADRDWADVLLIDDDATAVASDIQSAVALAGGAARVTSVREISDASGADVVVVADRDVDLAELAARCPQAIVLVAGDSVLVRTATALRLTAFPRQRVLGIAGEPQAAHLASLVARERGWTADAVDLTVIGVPGDGMIVLGEPVDDALVETVRESGPAGPAVVAAACTAMIDAIVADAGRVLVCATRCDGEYGIDGVVCVPVVIGERGVERILEVALDPPQLEALRAAAIA